MPDREISPPGRAAEVTVPEHAAAGRRQAVTVRLSQEAAEEYGVWQKEMPADLPDSYDGRPITWLNNIGLKRRGREEYAVSVPPYTVIVDREPRGGALVAYDPQRKPSLWELETEEVNGRVQATLDRGDPGVGWAG